MSFCQHFFQKEIEQVTVQDISSLILNNPGLEGTHLECKSWKNRGLRDFKREVKEVVAFLNTDGGLLILGTPEEQPIDPNDVSKGKVLQEPFYFHPYIPKDQLRDIMINSIEPIPIGVQIRIIKQGDDQYITLVDAPQGEYPPYQVGGTYYVRLEGSTRKASHAIVEALFNRRKPRYQQALIEHFKRKTIKFQSNKEAMTALYFLTLEHRTVPEPRIIAAVFRSDRVNVGLPQAEQLKRDLDELASQAGILVYKRNEEIRDFYGASYHGYEEYSINPEYQDVLADLIFEMHRENPFYIHYD